MIHQAHAEELFRGIILMNVEALVGKALGTCTLQSVIGRGEASIVFLAQQSRPRRQVAVKVLQPSLPVAPRQRAAIVERIRHEIDLIASLEHPNIIQIHEYGEHHGQAYLVMPHINGGTLHDEIERERPLSLEKVVFYLEQMAAALGYAHKRGMLHYGIKPANILMKREGRLLFTDFGQLKRATNRNNTHTRPGKSNTTTGSLDYAAPEQVAGNDIDVRANVYSLGVILYQMVTGIAPFKGEMAVHHGHISPLSPRVFRPDLPMAAEQVMLKALAVQPTDRYLHVQEFARAFRDALMVTGLADLSGMFISAGLSDPHMPIPQKPLDTKQQQARPTRQQKLAEAEQQQYQQTADKQRNEVLIDTSPTLHIVKKNTSKQRKDEHISTDEYPTIYLMDKNILKHDQDDNIPIDTSPAIHKVHKNMLKHDQNDRNDSVPPIDTSPAIHVVNKNVHKDDIVAKTRLTLPSLTSFLSPSPTTPSATRETPPAIPALQPILAQAPVQPVIEQEESPLKEITEPASQLPTTESRVQAVPTTAPKARIHAMPALVPSEISPEALALIEQAATLPPVNRPIIKEPVNQTKQPAKATEAQAAALPTIEKPVSRVKAPAKRASLLFLAGVVLLVILLLGTFAYMAKGHIPSSNDGLPPVHHSAKNTNTTSTYSQPGSKSFHVEEHLELVIKGHNSNVNIHTDNANTATVTTSLHGNNPGQAANNVTIQYAQSIDKQGHDHLNVTTNPLTSDIDYNVTVPASTQVRIEVTSGSIVVDGIDGVTINTGGGNLDIADIHGSVHAYTESGNITARAISGEMEMMSVNGSIRASNINGPIQAITQNGEVVVGGAMLDGQSTLETTNGSVHFQGSIDPQGSYKMTTNRGNIDVTLPANAAFQVDASTHSGNIHNAFGNTAVGSAPRAPIMITIGNGGSITINKGAV
jgi:serine/threonine protein kinase